MNYMYIIHILNIFNYIYIVYSLGGQLLFKIVQKLEWYDLNSITNAILFSPNSLY